MHESSTYEYILDQGRLMQIRKMLLFFGERRLGAPSAATIAAIDAKTNLERLRRMVDRIHEANSWTNLLSTP